jgi:Fe-S-cluster containining protein
MEQLENKDVCRKCGGKCCKKCGCAYVPSDFESMSIDYLQEKLKEGNISITSTLLFDKLNNGETTCTPFLYLRVRNINRPIVDILSFKTPCLMLKENGCAYNFEKRPTGGKNLVPQPDFKCVPKEDLEKLIIIPWARYQKTLARLVKRITGNSVDEQFYNDLENLFISIKNRDFKDVSKLELYEVTSLVPLLIDVYNSLNNESKKVKKHNI